MSETLFIGMGILAGLAVAAFFAACEGAFFQLTLPSDRDGLEPPAGSSRLARLLDRPDRLQGALELGHLLGVVWTAALIWALVRHWLGGAAGPLQWILAILAAAFLVVVVGELAPKGYGMERAGTWAARTSAPVAAWRALLTPLIAFAAALSRVTQRIMPPAPQAARMESEELRTMVAETTESAQIELGEREMISSIFAFGETTVREVMTPRTDIVAIEATTPWEAVIAYARESERSRIPVYEETLDAILGVVYAKDLLAIAHGASEAPDRLTDILVEATFVPEAKKIDDLLREFQRGHIHMAVVIDEYGGTAGIVTLEDILEELVGEIQDEYDIEEPLVVPLEDGVLRLDGRLDADDFNDLTGGDIEVDEVETVGGLVARELARVAAVGDTVAIGDWEFEVEAVEGKRIVRLLAWPREEPGNEGQGAR
ncbi:MAG TPA: hemolysin family protein [Gemmatimonadota bacterium]|nr:hemolysin family protein [Gemmatimonadota bacterium]